MRKEILRSAPTLEINLTELDMKLPDEEFLEKCVDLLRRRGRNLVDRWTPLELALFESKNDRLIVKYACGLGFRWIEAEPFIKNSTYLWNYLHFCLRDVSLRHFLHPEKITKSVVDRTPNTETRRVLIDLMGAEKYLKQIDAKVVHTDDHPINGKRALLRSGSMNPDRWDRETLQWLVCNCPSTGRVYFLTVPVGDADRNGVWIDIDTCDKADAWLCGSIEAKQIGRS